MRDLQYSRVDVQALPSVWPAVVAQIEATLRGNLVTTAQHLYAQLMTQQKTLWLCHEVENPLELANLVITEFVQYDTGLFMCVHGCATFPDHTLDLAFLHEFFVGYAKSANCIGYEIVGRYGWQRKLPELQMEGVVLRTTFNT